MAAYQRKDSAYRRAKEEGYRSRAAFKLEEMDRRFRLFRQGMRVVDLGCWPGAWLQYAASRVGERGKVVGIDLVPVDDLGRANVCSLAADVTKAETVTRILEILSGPADLLLSDLAPKLTGVRHADASRHAALVRSAIGQANELLAVDGTLVVKLFMDGEYPTLAKELREAYADVRVWRPETTRQGSAELYACARGRRAEVEPTP